MPTKRPKSYVVGSWRAYLTALSVLTTLTVLTCDRLVHLGSIGRKGQKGQQHKEGQSHVKKGNPKGHPIYTLTNTKWNLIYAHQ